MITLKDSIEIKATPEKVFEWLVQRMKDKESYQAWHPDHVDIRWIKGEPLIRKELSWFLGRCRNTRPLRAASCGFA